MTHKKFYSDLKRIVDITKKVICTVGVYLVITLWLAGLLSTYYYVLKLVLMQAAYLWYVFA